METTQTKEFTNDDGIRFSFGYTHNPIFYNIFTYQYYNLDSFLKALITMPINNEVFSSLASIEESYEFTKTNSFKEAWNLCRFGMDEGYQKFIEGLNYINFKYGNFEKKKMNYQCVGYVPNIPRFLNGNPNNMRIQKKEAIKSSITINIEASYSAYIDTQAIFNRGIFIINLIKYLESHNFDCILQLEAVSVCEDEMIKIVVPIKRDDEKINIKLCYFPLVHPSFLRRLLFRGKEIIPNISNSWGNGYGFPYKKNDYEIAAMKNTIYIPPADEMEIEGVNIDLDFQRFVHYIDEKYHIYQKVNEEEKLWKTYGKKLMYQ